MSEQTRDLLLGLVVLAAILAMCAFAIPLGPMDTG